MKVSFQNTSLRTIPNVPKRTSYPSRSWFFLPHYRLTFDMELCPHAMAVLIQCSGSKDVSFQGSQPDTWEGRDYKAETLYCTSYWKNSLPEQTSSVFWHLVSNLENILIGLIFSMTKYKLLPEERGKNADNLDYRVKDPFRTAALIQHCLGHQECNSWKFSLRVSKKNHLEPSWNGLSQSTQW